MLSVVIPAHNEEGLIAETVREVAAALKAAAIPYEIYSGQRQQHGRNREHSRNLEPREPGDALHQQCPAERVRLGRPPGCSPSSAAARWRS